MNVFEMELCRVLYQVVWFLSVLVVSFLYFVLGRFLCPVGGVVFCAGFCVLCACCV